MSDGVAPKDFVDFQVSEDRSNEGHAGSRRKHIKFATKLAESKVAHMWRYYVNMLSFRSNANRRSSITTGGKLQYPELELLPPVLGGSDDVSIGSISLQCLGKAASSTGTTESKTAGKDCFAGPLTPDAVASALSSDTPASRHLNCFSDNFSDMALEVDGAGDIIEMTKLAPPLSSSISAPLLSCWYRQQCLGSPLGFSSGCESATDLATAVPLPDTPTRLPSPKSSKGSTPMSPKRKVATAVLPCAPKARGSPRAVFGFPNKSAEASPKRMNDRSLLNAAENNKPISPTKCSDKSGWTGTLAAHEPKGMPTPRPELLVREFPSVTVLDDGKGQPRSVSFITTISSSRSSSDEIKEARSATPAVRTGLTPVKSRKAVFERDVEQPWRAGAKVPLSVIQSVDETEDSIDVTVGASTANLLKDFKKEEMQELANLKLLVAG